MNFYLKELKFMRAATMLLLMLLTTTAWAQEKKTPTVTTPPTASAITYGEMLAESTLSGGTATGENNEALSGTWKWDNATIAPKVSDSGKTGYSVIFTPSDPNYEEYTTTTTLTVNPKSVTVNITVENKIYDGNTDATVSGTVNCGIEGESVTVSGITGSFADKNVGTNKAVTINAANASYTGGSNTDINNYSFTVPASSTANITPKSVTVTADDKTKASDEDDPVFTATIEGMVEGEETSLLSFVFDREDENNNDEGIYAITPQGDAEQGNYSVTYVPGTLRIDAVLFAGNSTNAWMTWCDKNNYVKPENCSVYTVSGINGTTVTLAERQDGVIPANTPVLIYRTTTDRITAQFDSHGADKALASSEGTGYIFYGNASDAAITEGGFTSQPAYSLYNGRFYRYEGTQAIAAHRCLLTLSPVYTAPVLNIELGSTGMEEVVKLGVESGVKKDDSWYSLDGRKLNGVPTKKGIYINGGRKVVVR